MNKGISNIAGVMIAAVILIGAIGGYVYFKGQQTKSVVCSQDTKICPSGDVVTRIGSDCEFEQCPTGPLWKTYKNDQYGFNISYPYNLFVVLDPKVLHEAEIAYIPTLEEDFKISEYIVAKHDDYLLGVHLYAAEKCPTSSIISYDSIMINQIKFDYTSECNAAMGGTRGCNYVYQTTYNNTCYWIDATLFYHDISFITSVSGDTPREATETEIKIQETWIQEQNKLLKDIVSTFEFIK